jgi:two-component system OmpR family response regulator
MRILLAEDDERLCSRLRDDLARRGYAVDVARNGIDAEHRGTEEPYDAVILDLGLPERSGLEVLRSWRARGNAVPVLILRRSRASKRVRTTTSPSRSTWRNCSPASAP